MMTCKKKKKHVKIRKLCLYNEQAIKGYKNLYYVFWQNKKYIHFGKKNLVNKRFNYN